MVDKMTLYNNDFLMSFEDLTKSTCGKVLFDFTGIHAFSSVVIDSRYAKENSLFVPLRGRNQDGHLYIEDALKNGVLCFFADKEFVDKNKVNIEVLCKNYKAACIEVKNNLKALQDASKFYLSEFPNLYKVGVTGSSGKTTTKEILFSIFSQKYKTVCNEGNLNSETGLPLSVFNVRADHEVGIFELGMNRKGEISETVNVLLPNAAIITNIGTSHIGILGTKQAIVEEKKEIFSKFTKECVGFVPECEYTEFLKEVDEGDIFVYSKDNLPFVKGVEDLGLSGSKIFYKDETIMFPLPGKHNLQNAFACIALSERKGFSAIEIKKGLENVRAIFGRSQIITGFTTCFFDCYNANPDSMNEAIEFCNSVKTEKSKHYVLGSMLELGKDSEKAHEDICVKLFSSDADFIYLFGDDIFEAGKKLDWVKNVFIFKTNEFEKLQNCLKNNLHKDDFVLLKGSRGLALERLERVVKTGGCTDEDE